MGKRGPKPMGKVKIKWSSGFAYSIGLLATDGCLLNDGRHIELTSKDKDQLFNFMKGLNVAFNVTSKRSSSGAISLRVQFGDVLFYRFLFSIGLTPAKSKTIGAIQIPDKYFFDFLRGCFDGDGSFYSYWDRRWKSSFMFYTVFVSASKIHVMWIQSVLKKKLGVVGHFTKAKNGSVWQLKYAKKESLKILKKMYYSSAVLCLKRKRVKIEKALTIRDSK